MLIGRLWRYLRGYVSVSCCGGFFNRFFDNAMKAGLAIFGIKVSGNTARFKIYICDYKAIKKIAKKSQCRVRVAEKHGLYFGLRKIKNKAALVAGLLVFCIVIYIFGNMVFTIRIEGTSTIPKLQLIESLERNGLKVGMARGEIDVKAVEHGVMLENDRLSWIAVNLSFGTATVEVRDKVPTPDDEILPVQIIAKRDAQVKDINIVSGVALVEKGQVVVAGQVLVESTGLSPDGSWAAGADAKIMGYTEYTFDFLLGKHHVFRTQTGNTIVNKTLKLMDAEIKLTFNQNTFTYFDIITYETPIWLFSVELPARILITEYIEVEQTAKTLNEQEAYDIFSANLLQYEREQLAGCEIMNRTIDITDAGTEFVYTVKYLCLEDIGIGI